MPKLFLIDGHAYIHRAYHALPPLSTSRGEIVNAVYGFIRLLLKIIRQEKPGYLAVCFDHPAPTFRHREFAAYKAHRKEIESELKTQMPLAREAVRALNIALIEKEGFEADDLIATLARQAARDSIDVVIVTADKDALQLVDERISVYNESRNFIYDTQKVKEKYGLLPAQLTDMFALAGDASDNIPGARGIGEKTAVKLISDYGSVENLLEHTGELKGKMKENVVSSAPDITKSKYLVTLIDNVPLDLRWQDTAVKKPDEQHALEFLRRLEFTTLIDEILPVPSAGAARDDAAMQPAGFETEIVTGDDQLDALIRRLTTAERISFDVETTGLDPHRALIVGLSFAVETGKGYYIPVGHSAGNATQLSEGRVMAAVKGILENPGLKKYGQNMKYDIIMLRRHGIDVAGVYFDSMIASYCLNPSRLTHNLKTIALDYLNERMTGIEELIGSGAKQISMDLVPIERAAPYAVADAVTVLRLADRLEPELSGKKLDRLFFDIEMPLVTILADMERRGIKVDVAYLQELSKEFAVSITAIEKEIHRIAGETFNLNSTKQLAVILFEKLKLPVIRRTKTGYSTDEETLKALASSHELPARIIEYRELQKLKSTYIDSLVALADDSGRVRTSLNQAVTATGRLSSSEPNLQNIPVRTEYGRKIRRAFIPCKGNALLSADYSQIDLRVLAHVSEDPALLDAFKTKQDVHAATAAEVFGVDVHSVSPAQRRIAKTINFGIIYGMSSFGLAQQLSLSPSEAQTYIDRYFERYRGVKNWIEAVIAQARAQGYVTTLTGRIRYLPEIRAANAQVRKFAERTAMNTPIQGTSADIIKIAMIRIHKAMTREHAAATMLMQVHDELLFEIPEGDLAASAALIKNEMESAMGLSVPVIVDIKSGQSWADMKKLEL